MKIKGLKNECTLRNFFTPLYTWVKYVNPVFQLIWDDCGGEVGAWILTQQFVDFSQNILIV